MSVLHKRSLMISRAEWDKFSFVLPLSNKCSIALPSFPKEFQHVENQQFVVLNNILEIIKMMKSMIESKISCS
jgi:hypothetical protein